jgi:hypothetical protein
MWRMSRSKSIIRWQDYRVSASRLAESNFRYTQDEVSFSIDQRRRLSVALVDDDPVMYLVGQLRVSKSG